MDARGAGRRYTTSEVTQIAEIEDRLHALREDQLDAVLAFIELLADEREANIHLTLASEEVLARDWLRPEEDEAWAGL